MIVLVRMNQKVIATVSGDMDGAAYHFDLYGLDQEIFVIRMWFFWLSMTNFKNKVNLKPIKEIKKSRSLLSFKDPELPDFERFDLVSGT